MGLLSPKCALVAPAIAALMLVGSASPSSAAVTTLRTIVASVQPRPGEVVGVAAPIVVTFTQPVADRAAVERAFTITTPNSPTGQFEWLSSNTLQWKPDGFWPAHSTVELSLGGFKTDI